MVKIMNKKVGGGAYYKAKGTVTALEPGNPFVGVISVPAASAAAASTPASAVATVLLKLDQADLETVIPAAGERVVFVRGNRRGAQGILRQLHIDDYQASVELVSGGAGSGIVKAEYEDISKLA